MNTACIACNYSITNNNLIPSQFKWLKTHTTIYIHKWSSYMIYHRWNYVLTFNAIRNVIHYSPYSLAVALVVKFDDHIEHRFTTHHQLPHAAHKRIRFVMLDSLFLKETVTGCGPAIGQDQQDHYNSQIFQQHIETFSDVQANYIIRSKHSANAFYN